MAELRAVVIDWGGVLTQPMVNTVRAWITADQIDWDRYVAVVGPWLAEAYKADGADGDHAVNPVHALERGECTVADFERMLAGLLVTTNGGPVLAEGLLTRMLSAGRHFPPCTSCSATCARGRAHRAAVQLVGADRVSPA